MAKAALSRDSFVFIRFQVLTLSWRSFGLRYRASSPSALIALAEEDDLVGSDVESIGDASGYALGAAGDVIDSFAVIAAEVVMMFQVSRLVACGFSRQFDSADEACFGERFDATIDRGDVDAADGTLRKSQDFRGQQRPARAADRVFDGMALACLAFHGVSLWRSGARGQWGVRRIVCTYGDLDSGAFLRCIL